MSRVYVGHLPQHCSPRDIEKFFKGYGRLRDIVLKNGYGFVEFADEKDAEDAIYELHGQELRGERIVVEMAKLPAGGRSGPVRRNTGRERNRYGPPTRTEYRVLVENLSSRVSWQDLKDYMREAGQVTYADAHKGSRNDGIVEFATYSDMKEAIRRFDGCELYGRRLRVYEDRPGRDSRSVSRDRSRSDSRRKSRNRDTHWSSNKRRSYSRSRSDSRSRSPMKRSRDESYDRQSRSISHRSSDGGSRSVSRNGSLKNGSRQRSRSGSSSRSRSRSRSSHSRSRDHSRSKSSGRSKSASVRHSDEEPVDDQRSGNERNM